MTSSSRPVLAVAAAVAAVAAVGVVLSVTDDRRQQAPVAVPRAAAVPEDMGATAKAAGIPLRALTAYVAAAEQLAVDTPGCRLAWNTLAGIGASESSHGSFGGARLDREGVAAPSIIGVALDGTGGNAAIRDSDGGRLDDDRTWDRAVGPMQFIPTTWARWGADADGDGRKDPHDLDDAALAAGRYLCDAGGDLGASDGWSRAVLTYNRSVPYASKVADTATRYADEG